MKFRKKPIVIEAMKYDGTEASFLAIIDWTVAPTKAFGDTEVRNCSPAFPDGFDYPVLKIRTLEGDHTVSPGDWVICGVAGEFYPCKDGIFAATYEPA